MFVVKNGFTFSRFNALAHSGWVGPATNSYFSRKALRLLISLQKKIGELPKNICFSGRLFDRYDIDIYPFLNQTDRRLLHDNPPWTQEEHDLIQQIISAELDRPFRFADIGANMGLYTMLAAKLCEDAGRSLNAVCVEPQESVGQRLEKNLQSAGIIDSCHIEMCAVGEQNGTLELMLHDTNQGEASMVRQPTTSLAGTEIVETRLLRELIDRFDSQPVDLMKIDIEGYEAKVLEPFFRDTSNAIWPRWVHIETIHDATDELRKILTKNGYVERLRGTFDSIFKLDV